MGLEEIGIYIVSRYDTVAQYIATRPIMDLCLAEERNPGMRPSRRWWEQTALDIMWISVGQAAVEGVEETGRRRILYRGGIMR